ncbi:MAG: ABC transporter permease subunit, partial [Isosphaeraceae bacterium]
MMKSLLWKECRLSALIVAFGAALWCGPYLLGVLSVLVEKGGTWKHAADWADSLTMASGLSVTFSLITALLFGANAIACERADRSAEFLAYLPPSREAVLLSKAFVPLAAALVVWGSNVFVSLVVVPSLGGGSGLGELVSFWWQAASWSVLFFGSAWLASSCAGSASSAFTLGLAGSMAVMTALFGLTHLFPSG